jgi:hypothetical protein
MKHKYFYMCDAVPPVEGITNGQYWNGWSTPSFQKKDAIQILEFVYRFDFQSLDLTSENVYRYDSTSDSFVIETYEESVLIDSEIIPPVVFEGKEWFPIGCFEWTWQEIDESPIDEELLRELKVCLSIAIKTQSEISIDIENATLSLSVNDEFFEKLTFEDNDEALEQAYAAEKWFDLVVLE